jgi:integrase
MSRLNSTRLDNMGRPRNPKNKDLPPGMTRRVMKSGAVHYYAAAPEGKKIPLGSDLAAARVKWAELKRGDHTTAKDLFADVAARFRKEWLPEKSPKTQREYEYSLRRLEQAFKGARLGKILPMHIRQYLDMRKSKISANRDMSTFSALFNFARSKGITSVANPTQGIERHTEESRDIYVTGRQYAAVWWAAGPELRDLMDIAVHTGQREADILKMRITDIHDGRLWVKQNKTGAKLGINIVGRLAWIIKRARNRKRSATGPYLVQTEDGQRLTYSMFRKRFDEARKVAGATWQFRDLRAKAATDLDNVKQAQQLLGHKSETTTARIYRRRMGEIVDPVQ